MSQRRSHSPRQKPEPSHPKNAKHRVDNQVDRRIKRTTEVKHDSNRLRQQREEGDA